MVGWRSVVQRIWCFESYKTHNLLSPNRTIPKLNIFKTYFWIACYIAVVLVNIVNQKSLLVSDSHVDNSNS